MPHFHQSKNRYFKRARFDISKIILLRSTLYNIIKHVKSFVIVSVLFVLKKNIFLLLKLWKGHHNCLAHNYCSRLLAKL